MRNYDFIEIGTSDFWTCIEKATDETVGLSIEPIQVYLDNLPDKPNVKKICCAVSTDNTARKNKIYYIPPDVIEEHGLSFAVKGCNTIGGYHSVHKNLKITHLVKIEEIDEVPLAKILNDNEVNEIDFLKLDTEGKDCDILLSFLPYLKQNLKIKWPKKIQFESNQLTPKREVLNLIDMYMSIGYEWVVTTKTDTVLKLGK